MVKFSIITPFYKGNKYVPALVKMAESNAVMLDNACVEASVELIIVNDSPSETVNVPEHKNIVSIRVINQEKNGGIHYARITGLVESAGEYVLFLDQDDEISDKCLLEEYKTMKDNDVVVANALFEHADGSRTLHFKGKGQYKNAFELAPYVKGHNRIISPGHCLIRKSAIPKEWTEYIVKTNGSDDLFLWLLMLMQKKKFVMYCTPLYVHKYTGGNLSAEGVKMAESSVELAGYLKKIDYVPKKVPDNIIRRRNMYIEGIGKGKLWKICNAIRNIDIIILRVMWKIRAGMGKIHYDSDEI